MSDVELTRVSAFVEKLRGKSGVSIMADHGFTVKDQLAAVSVNLNIPPFMQGHQQLPTDDVFRGSQIASLHIMWSVLIKNYTVLKMSLPISMARIANQVFALLVNFQSVLLPPLPVTENNKQRRSSTIFRIILCHRF